jgi:hypothetical protein
MRAAVPGQERRHEPALGRLAAQAPERARLPVPVALRAAVPEPGRGPGQSRYG